MDPGGGGARVEGRHRGAREQHARGRAHVLRRLELERLGEVLPRRLVRLQRGRVGVRAHGLKAGVFEKGRKETDKERVVVAMCLRTDDNDDDDDDEMNASRVCSLGARERARGDSSRGERTGERAVV